MWSPRNQPKCKQLVAVMKLITQFCPVFIEMLYFRSVYLLVCSTWNDTQTLLKVYFGYRILVSSWGQDGVRFRLPIKGFRREESTKSFETGQTQLTRDRGVAWGVEGGPEGTTRLPAGPCCCPLARWARAGRTDTNRDTCVLRAQAPCDVVSSSLTSDLDAGLGHANPDPQI